MKTIQNGRHNVFLDYEQLITAILERECYEQLLSSSQAGVIANIE